MTLALVTMLGWIFNILDLVNFLVIHNEMIATNGLWNFETTDNTFCLTIKLN